MKIPEKHFLLPCLALIAFSLLCSQNTLADESAVPFGIRSYPAGVAPNFTLNDIDGQTLSLKDTRGQWVFLHFWASWCGPCRKEMPEIQHLFESTKGENIAFVLINTAEDEDTVFTFMASIGVELNSLLDEDGLVTEQWKPRGLPTTFLIDPDGKIQYQAIGGRDWDQPLYIDFLNKLPSQSSQPE